MGLTRRQVAIMVTSLYGSAGLLLLYDYFSDPSNLGAHLPMAWHVFPVSVLVSIFAFLADVSAPLDPEWYVATEVIVAGFLLALLVCCAVLMRLIRGGHSNAVAKLDQDGGTKRDYSNQGPRAN